MSSAALASPLIVPSSLMGAGSSANPFLDGLSSNGLFLSLLDPSALSHNAPAYGNGVSFDPSALVLPAGVADLSAESLKDYLVRQMADEGLSEDILLALTPGTPLSPEMLEMSAGEPAESFLLSSDGMFADAHLLSGMGYGTLDDSANEGLSEDSTSLLLIATGLTPAQMEAFQKRLLESAAADTESKDLGDAMNNLALVHFMAPTLPQESGIILSTAAGHNLLGEPEILGGFGTQLSSFGHAHQLRPFEVGELAQESAKGTDIDAGYIADFAKQFGATNAAQGTPQAVTSQERLPDTFANLDALGLFFSPDESYATSAYPDGGNLLLHASNISSPLLNHTSAGAGHPATQTVQASLLQAAKKNEKEAQTLVVQLDPPELGRVQVHLSYEKGDPIKVRIITEKQESLGILSRDSYALKSALEQAGIQTDNASLSFDMAGGNQSFDDMLNQSQDGHKENGGAFTVDAGGRNVADNYTTLTIDTQLSHMSMTGISGHGYSFLA